MAANQPPWPREWLMTDERVGDRLWEAIAALPRGGGVVFRHYATPEAQRELLAQQVADICRRRELTLAIARDLRLAEALGAAMVHNPVSDPDGLPASRAAHSAEEAIAAEQAGASLIFLSPVFPTRSHPGRPPLPNDVVRQIIATCSVPVIALGGMNRRQFEEIRPAGFHGWAGIDAWLGN